MLQSLALTSGGANLKGSVGFEGANAQYFDAFQSDGLLKAPESGDLQVLAVEFRWRSGVLSLGVCTWNRGTWGLHLEQGQKVGKVRLLP